MNNFSEILDGINNIDTNSAVEYHFDNEVCIYINEQSRAYSEELSVKEAGSWESANRLVLTD